MLGALYFAFLRLHPGQDLGGHDAPYAGDELWEGTVSDRLRVVKTGGNSGGTGRDAGCDNMGSSIHSHQAMSLHGEPRQVRASRVFCHLRFPGL